MTFTQLVLRTRQSLSQWAALSTCYVVHNCACTCKYKACRSYAHCFVLWLKETRTLVSSIKVSCKVRASWSTKMELCTKACGTKTRDQVVWLSCDFGYKIIIPSFKGGGVCFELICLFVCRTNGYHVVHTILKKEPLQLHHSGETYAIKKPHL